MHSKMDVPKISKRLIIWSGGSIKLLCCWDIYMSTILDSMIH